MSQVAVAEVQGADARCPMCLCAVAKARHWKPLLGRRICKRCRNRYILRRELGYIIDVVLYTLAVRAVLAAAVFLAPISFLERRPAAGSAGGAVLQAAGMLLEWVVLPLIFCLRDAWAGRSPGKVLCGLRVRDAVTREAISPGRSLQRNLPLMIPSLGALIYLITLYLGRRWGDRWAGAMVVWERYAHRPPFAPDGRLCFECGYDLTGNLSGVCPECGRPVDPPAAARPASQGTGS